MVGVQLSTDTHSRSWPIAALEHEAVAEMARCSHIHQRFVVRIDDKLSAMKVLVISLHPISDGECFDHLSMCAYLRSACVRVRDAYPMGCSVPCIFVPVLLPVPLGRHHMLGSTTPCVCHGRPIVSET